MTATRTETDSLGAIDVPADRYWGAQTQRSLENFRIGDERMPRAVVHALALVKAAAATAKISWSRMLIIANLIGVPLVAIAFFVWQRRA